MSQTRQYDRAPHYPVLGQAVCTGWPAIASTLGSGPLVLAVDGLALIGAAWHAAGPVAR